MTNLPSRAWSKFMVVAALVRLAHGYRARAIVAPDDLRIRVGGSENLPDGETRIGGHVLCIMRDK